MTTILLDGDIYLHRACSVATTSAVFGDEATWSVNLPHAEAWFKGELAKLRQRLGAKAVLVALGDRTANFRKELSPAYKAHRVAPRPPGFLEFEARIVAKCKTVREPRLEGDDVLGLLATSPKIEDGVIVTIDKDLKQIPGRIYNPDKDTMEEISPEAGEMLHFMQTLTGDRVDGYPGLPGCGPKTTAKILPQPGHPDYEAGRLWCWVKGAFERKGLTEADALLQARLAFILRQGYYNRETKEIKLWRPS